MNGSNGSSPSECARSWIRSQSAQTDTSTQPLDESLVGTSARVNVDAIADPFSVYAASSARYCCGELSAFAHAIADTELEFSPLMDSFSALVLTVETTGQNYFTEGWASLFDRTANTWVWNYGWDWGHTGNLTFLQTGAIWTTGIRATF